MATTVPGPVERHDNDWTSAETAAGRNVGLSLWRGVRGRCPRCGRGRLFCAFLKVDDHCSVCRLDFTMARIRLGTGPALCLRLLRAALRLRLPSRPHWQGI